MAHREDGGKEKIEWSFSGFSGLAVILVLEGNQKHPKTREVPLDQTVFGNLIGYWAATKGQMGDTIESIQSNRIVLLSKGFRYVERSILDLNSNTIQVIEVQSERNQTIWILDKQKSPGRKTK